MCACGHDQSGSNKPVRNVFLAAPSGVTEVASRSFAGIVEEKDEVSIGFKTPGEINSIFVKEGQTVHKGQLMATLDDTDYRLGVDALQIQYDQVKDEVERAHRLFEKKSMTPNDYEKAVAGLKQLGVQLQVNKNKLAYTRLYSPVSGTVSSVNFSVGEMVDAGTAVFTMLDLSHKIVVADIPANVYLRRDDISRITCRANHADTIWRDMKILSIVPKADNSQLYRLKLGFSSTTDGVTPGMNVEVRIDFDSSGSEGIKLPHSAVFRKDGADCVWVVGQDSTVKLRKVEIEPHCSGPEVVIRSGLTGDDNVIRAGVRMLHEGDKVNIIAEPSATNAGGML